MRYRQRCFSLRGKGKVSQLGVFDVGCEAAEATNDGAGGLVRARRADAEVELDEVEGALLCETEAGEAEVCWPCLDKGCELKQGCGAAIGLVPASLGSVECQALEGGLWGVGWHGMGGPVRRLMCVWCAASRARWHGAAGCARGGRGHRKRLRVFLFVS